MCSENGLNFIAKTVNIKVSAREEDYPHKQYQSIIGKII